MPTNFHGRPSSRSCVPLRVTKPVDGAVVDAAAFVVGGTASVDGDTASTGEAVVAVEPVIVGASADDGSSTWSTVRLSRDGPGTGSAAGGSAPALSKETDGSAEPELDPPRTTSRSTCGPA